ncbi:glycoside hydrolase family 28 protein [Atractiella rhizophila]|nr:glycoside hydrolase family 28 protein [Atractiella rhizophila]
MVAIIHPLFRAFSVADSLRHATWPIHQAVSPNRTCVVQQLHGRQGDDTDAVIAAFQQCSQNARVVFKEGITYNAYRPVQITGLNNVEVEINGNIQLPTNISYIQNLVAEITAEGIYGNPWFYIQGNDVSIVGSDDPRWGWFQGHGQQWWDIRNQTNRPRLAVFNVTNGYLAKLKHKQMIAWSWSLPGSNILVEKCYSDNRPTNGTRDETISFPFNTDGFNVGGKNVRINNYFGYNGDDAVSIVSGAKNVTVTNVYCGFSSHGMSIGSLGKNGANSIVEDVLFENVTMEGAVYGARFKSWVGGNGHASNVVYRNFKLINVSTAVFITQNYYDQALGPPPVTNSTNSTKVSNFHFENFVGYLNPRWTDGTCLTPNNLTACWNYVQGGDSTQGVILDLYNRTATNLTFKNIHVRPYRQGYDDTTVICDPSVFDQEDLNNLGFVCRDGLYEET